MFAAFPVSFSTSGADRFTPSAVAIVKLALLQKEAEEQRLLPYANSENSDLIDLHCHILPGVDDGAADLAVSLRMAEASAAAGVRVIACTPHILPGLHHNTGPQIRSAVASLQRELDERNIDVRLVAGADNHLTPDFIAGLREGRLLALADSRYVLVEPPHHVAPVRLEEFFFSLVMAGYTPILTHPERLTWIEARRGVMERLARSGVWLQITAGSLLGAFGRQPQYWAERLLDEGAVHIIASDAHDLERRPPDLGKGRERAAKRVGDAEAEHLVTTRPKGVLTNEPPSRLPAPRLRKATAEEPDERAHRKNEKRAQMRFGGGRTDYSLWGLPARLRNLL
jgi:protein-tyrosine phosphatase